MPAAKLIYLASPYSHPLPFVRKQRFLAVAAQAAKMMSEGLLVFSPIAHTHPIAEAGELPQGWDFWQRFDRAFLERCDSLVVLMLPGWRESQGVLAEIAIMGKLGKPIKFIRPA